MNRWTFDWWHFSVLYGVLIGLNGAMAILEKEIGTLGAYLIVLAMCLVANLFFYALQKNAPDAKGDSMARWTFDWWHFFVLYGALIVLNGVLAIFEKEIGTLGAYLIILAMFLVANLFFFMRRKNATDAG